MNKKVIKIVGLAATVLGTGLTLVTEWVNDKKIDDKIAEKVSEALSNKI